jgi:hypothetical protein
LAAGLFEKPFGEPCEKADADRQRVVVEIVAGVVEETTSSPGPLPSHSMAPGRAFSMNEKSSPPIDGATLRMTCSWPQISAATSAANSVSAAWLIVGG